MITIINDQHLLKQSFVLITKNKTITAAGTATTTTTNVAPLVAVLLDTSTFARDSVCKPGDQPSAHLCQRTHTTL